jgi:hypothetical protein
MRALGLCFILVTCLAGVGCGSDSTGNDGGTGTDAASTDAMGPTDGTADHDGTPINDSGTGGIDAGSVCTTPGATGLDMSCSVNSDCASCLCFMYNNRGKLCSHTCSPATAATDCPAPFIGLCNGM